MRHTPAEILLLTALGGALALAPAGGGSAIGRAQTAHSAAVIGLPIRPGIGRIVRPFGLDPLAVRAGVLYVLAGEPARRRLSEAGWPSFEAGNLFPGRPLSGAQGQGGPNGAYHTYLEMESDLADLAARFPRQARLRLLGRSLEGRRLSALKISDNPGLDEDEPGVLLAGGHHAREWISVEVPFQIARRLLESYGSDPDVRRLVDGCEIWVAPLLNPDGLEYSIGVYRYWRKNRRDNGDGTFGVDLNRNYDFRWGADDVGSSPEPGDETFRGPSPFSEPETRALRDLALARPFSTVIFYHSFGQTILYPWAWTIEPPPDRDLLRTLSLDLSALMAPVEGRTYAVGQSGPDLYVSNGDAADWTYGGLGSTSLTIELPPLDLLNGGFFNAEADIASVSAESWPAALEILRRALQDFAPGGREDASRIRRPPPEGLQIR